MKAMKFASLGDYTYKLHIFLHYPLEILIWLSLQEDNAKNSMSSLCYSVKFVSILQVLFNLFEIKIKMANVQITYTTMQENIILYNMKYIPDT